MQEFASLLKDWGLPVAAIPIVIVLLRGLDKILDAIRDHLRGRRREEVRDRDRLSEDTHAFMELLSGEVSSLRKQNLDQRSSIDALERRVMGLMADVQRKDATIAALKLALGQVAPGHPLLEH